ncbi:hypothetical protein U1Q18_006196 [Sarracenia purpurea var. burkii]
MLISRPVQLSFDHHQDLGKVRASPLPSALEPLPGSKRAVDDEDEAQKDEDSITAQVPTEVPEGSTLNPKKRKVSDYGSGQDEDEGGAIDGSFYRYQAKRVVGHGNNLLGSRYVPAFGHATEKCKKNEQAEENEGWTQVGKDKGKAPMQNSSSPGKSDEPDPYIAASPIFEPVCSMGKEVASGILEEGAQLVDPTPVTQVPLPETSSLEKGAQSAADEHLELPIGFGRQYY